MKYEKHECEIKLKDLSKTNLHPKKWRLNETRMQNMCKKYQVCSKTYLISCF